MHEEKRKCRKRRRVLTYYFKALRDSPTNKRVKFKFFRLALMACHSRLSCCLKNLWNCSWLERKGFLLCLHCPWSSLLTPSILTYFLRPESEVPFLGSLPRPGLDIPPPLSSTFRETYFWHSIGVLCSVLSVTTLVLKTSWNPQYAVHIFELPFNVVHLSEKQ
jgi:hypothetical protein